MLAFLAPLWQVAEALNLIDNIEHLYYRCLVEDVKAKK